MNFYIPKERRRKKRKVRQAVFLSPRKNQLSFRLVGALLLVSMNTVGFAGVGHTVAFFNDIEVSKNNLIEAGLVDFSLANHSFDPIQTAFNLDSGATTSKYIDVLPNSLTNSFQYFASSTNFGLDLPFCNELLSKVSIVTPVSTTTLFSGPIKALNSATTTEVFPWHLELFLPELSSSVNSVCSFDTDFNGWQTRHDFSSYENGGFSDTETVSHVVYSAGLRLNKIYYDVDETTERVINKCEARSPGYWSNHDGCTNGSGSSDWQSQINAFSSGFSGVFATSTGVQICEATVTSSCSSANTNFARQCRAKRHLVSVELDTVSGNLDLDSIIAGADNGDSAFDRLGLSGTSTARQLIIKTELIINSATSTSVQYNDAAKVLERLYTFYEDENPVAPFCSYGAPDDPGRGSDSENEWVEIYNQTNDPIDLANWSICDGQDCDIIPTGGTTTIPAQGFAIITGTSTTWDYWRVQSDIIRIVLPDGSIGDGLHKDADMLLLKRPDDLIIDQMNYGDPDNSWPNANSDLWVPGVADVPEGHLIGRKPNGYDTNQSSDWVHFAPPLVTLIYPDPGDSSESWFWGHTYDITWTATNLNGPDSDLLIDLFYIEDLDNSVSVSTPDTIKTIATSTLNDGHHLFTVPSGFLGWVWVKLVAQGPENPLMNTTVVSGRLYDPLPIPLNDLWGEEQAEIPEEVSEGELDLVEEFSTGAESFEVNKSSTTPVDISIDSASSTENAKDAGEIGQVFGSLGTSVINNEDKEENYSANEEVDSETFKASSTEEIILTSEQIATIIGSTTSVELLETVATTTEAVSSYIENKSETSEITDSNIQDEIVIFKDPTLFRKEEEISLLDELLDGATTTKVVSGYIENESEIPDTTESNDEDEALAVEELALPRKEEEIPFVVESEEKIESELLEPALGLIGEPVGLVIETEVTSSLSSDSVVEAVDPLPVLESASEESSI